MKTTVLAVCHIKKDDAFLFRKKPDGSLPYKETWYAFGAPLDGNNRDPELAIKTLVKKQTGVDVTISQTLWWDAETKPNNDGVETFFVYLHNIAEYVSGELQLSAGIEQLKWINVSDLQNYDIVPPSRDFLKRYVKN